LSLTFYQIGFHVITDIIIHHFYQNNFNVDLSGPELGIKNYFMKEEEGDWQFFTGSAL